jgi:iron complex outermembrane recepter protein
MRDNLMSRDRGELMSSRRLVRNIVRSSILLGAIALVSSAWAVAEGLPRPLPAQPLADALDGFARYTGLQVVYRAELTNGLQSQGAEAGLSAEQALISILRDTGLSFQFVNAHTVTLTVALKTSDIRPGTADSIPPLGGKLEFRVAQADQTKAPGESVEDTRDAASSTPLQIEEILVTGTNIRGVQNSTSPVLLYDRAAIDRSGYSTVSELIENIPQNFGGGANGASEDGLVGVGSTRLTNFSAATGVNLRGLGNVATLVLINGHRVASGAFGSLVDTSMLPLSAVERVEILTDGSSAIYGADAVAGVVNVILRSDYEGAESRLRFGSTTEEGPQERLAAQSFGAQWDEGNVLLGLQFRDRGALSANDRDFSAGRRFPADLLPDLTQRNAVLTVRQSFDGLDLSGDVLYATKNSDRLFLQSSTQPGNSQVSAAVKNLSATLGAGHDFAGSDWRADSVFSFGKDETDQSNVARYTLASSPTLSHNEFSIKSAELKLDGRLSDLPGGTVRLAIGASYREEEFAQQASTPLRVFERNFSRDIKAAFAELHVPLVGASNALPGVQHLALSLAARHDDYSDFGSTTNPKFGVLWSPIQSLDVRASYSTSFRAPNSNEIIQTLVPSSVIAFTALSPTGTGTVPIFLLGGAEELGPEESQNVTAGFTFTPQWAQGLRLSFNYYDVEYTDRIQQPAFTASVLRNPGIYGSVIQTFADDAAAQAFLDAQVAAGLIFNNNTGTGATGVRYLFDSRLRNVSRLDQDGFDVTADYGFELGANRFNASVNASFIDGIDVILASGALPDDLVDTFGNPIDERYRADLGWGRGGFHANLALNHSGSYLDSAGSTRATVDAWTTTDINLRYSPSNAAWLRGSTFVISALNVFNKAPPFANGVGLLNYGYDAANADPLGRFVAVELRKAW